MADLGSKAALKAKIINIYVFPNTTNEVSAQDVQDSFIDTIDTLKTENFENTDYSSLAALKTGNLLVPGTFYIFDFQTIHRITGTSTINTGSTETLTVLAATTSTFFPGAASQQFPNDKIVYNFDDDVAEDGSTARPGKITYREDTINNLSTYFDFREVLHRRFGADSTGNTVWAGSTAYSQGDIVINGAIFYRAKRDIDVSIASFNSTDWIEVWNTGTDTRVGWGSTISLGSAGSNIATNSAVFTDTLTFGNNCSNISVGYGPLYNDITFGDNCFNISIGNSGVNMTFLSAQNLEIEDGCGDIYVSSGTQSRFGRGVKYTVLKSGAQNCNIENDSSAIFNGGTGNNVGSNSSGAVFDASSDNNTIGSGSNENSFTAASENKLDNDVNGTYFDQSSANTIGPASTDNTFIKANGNVLMGANNLNTIQSTSGAYPLALFNVFSTGVSTVDCQGAIVGCYLGPESGSLTINNGAALVNCVFASEVKNKTFDAIFRELNFALPDTFTETFSVGVAGKFRIAKTSPSFSKIFYTRDSEGYLVQFTDNTVAGVPGGGNLVVDAEGAQIRTFRASLAANVTTTINNSAVNGIYRFNIDKTVAGNVDFIVGSEQVTLVGVINSKFQVIVQGTEFDSGTANVLSVVTL